MNKFEKAISMINAAKTVAVFSHTSYDCDALGSMFGLGEFLKSQGKKVQLFLDDEISPNDAKLFDPNLLSAQPKPCDLCILVDAASLNLIGKHADFFASQKNTLRLDHHKGIFKSASVEIVQNTSSAAEVILNLIEKMCKKPNKKTATYLFAGLASDSASFLTTNVTKDTYQNAFKLASFGADTQKVNQILFKTKSLAAEKLRSKVFEQIKIYDNDIAITQITQKDFKTFGIKESEVKFTNDLIYLDGINIACLIKQTGRHFFRCSFRSMPGVDVAKIAQKLGGGGHAQAAGCRLKGNLKQVREAILKAIRENR